MAIVKQMAVITEAWREGTEGMAWKLDLPQSLPFKPGQFVMVELEGTAKAFSIASSPTRPGIELLAKEGESAFKKKWAEKKAGDCVSVA